MLQSEGVVSQAARLLRMNRTTLIEKMRKLRIRGEDD
ncbi:MAG TPA: helix-turn-helix domain-containing protein [Thiotrichales bacterium]|nr:helix-turn-helix domain-containing protein [Thiotrichales bacterium]